MGTRHLICVVKDGNWKVAQYGQWDGYPEGQGIDALHFLRDVMERPAFDDMVAELEWITPAEIAAINEELDGSQNLNDLYPALSRDTGAGILPLIFQNNRRTLKLQNHVEFAKDSLLCEFAYVIDLDKNTFEFYRGFNKEPLGPDERFYSEEPHLREYQPVKLFATFDLNNLPSDEDFINQTVE